MRHFLCEIVVPSIYRLGWQVLLAYIRRWPLVVLSAGPTERSISLYRRHSVCSHGDLLSIAQAGLEIDNETGVQFGHCVLPYVIEPKTTKLITL